MAACFPSAAYALDTGDIVVTSIKGEVHVTINGAERALKPGGVLDTPAAIRTGRDGTIELKQGATSVSVGPETLLEFPAQEKRGGAIDRIVQPRGNAFYSIGKREGRKLRVETPYLVGVIKGTQFNVAAQDESTTISLFEGRLEVHATDESDVVDLNAGEIATRKRGDKSITVMKMDGKMPTTAPRPSSSGTGGNGTPGTGGNGATTPSGPRPANGDDSGSLLAGGVSANPVISTTLNTPNGVANVNANAAVSLDVRANAADLSVGAGVNVGATGVAVDVGAAVNVAPLGTDVTSNTSLGVTPGAVDLTTNTSVNAGPVAADLGASTAVDIGTSGVSAAVNAGASAALGTTPVVDTQTSAAVDLGTTTAVAINTGTSVAGVDTGVAAAVNATAGTVDIGLNVAGVNVAAGVDLGLGNSTTTTTTTTAPTPTPPVIDVGGLLDGLLRRRGK